MKRTLSILLTVAMMLTLLVGCSTPEESASTAPADDSTESEASTDDGGEPAEMTALEDYDDVLVIDAFFSGAADPDENYLVHDWLIENIKIDINSTRPSGDTAETMLALMISTGDMPDLIFNWTSNRALLQQFVDSDLVLALDDYLPNMPDYMSFVNDDIIDYYRDANDGMLYMLPGYTKPPERADELLGDPYIFGIRSDILELTGMDAPTTYEELYDFLVAAKESVPADDPMYENFIPFNLQMLDLDYMIYSAFGEGLSTGYVLDEENGTLYEEYMSDGWEEAYVYLAKLYREGLIDPNIMTDTETDVLEKGKQGRYGAMFTNINWFNDQMAGALVQAGYEGVFTPHPVPDSETVDFENDWYNYNSLGVSLALFNKDLEDPERVLQYVNWQNTEIGTTTTWWGVPDEENGYWYLDDENNRVWNTPFHEALAAGTATATTVGSWIYWIAGPGVSMLGDFDDSHGRPAMSDMHALGREYGYDDAYNDISIDKFSYALKGPMYEQTFNDIETIVEKWKAEIITRSTSDDDARQMVQDMRAELIQAGIEEVGKENYEIYVEQNS